MPLTVGITCDAYKVSKFTEELTAANVEIITCKVIVPAKAGSDAVYLIKCNSTPDKVAPIITKVERFFISRRTRNN